MNILTRFQDIMSVNINILLDKTKDPKKIIEQYLRNLNNDLETVTSEIATIMAEEQHAKKELDECNEDIKKIQRFLNKAVESGNDSDAEKFLEKRAILLTNQTALEQHYQRASANATKIQIIHEKLVNDIKELEHRKTTRL